MDSFRHLRTRIIVALLATAAALFVAACGGSEEEATTPVATASPAAAASPAATPATARYCQISDLVPPDLKVDITAKWTGKDHIVIEGSASVSGPGTVNYWICQDGQLATFLVRARQPTFEGGKISAESKVDESRGGKFDPNADFRAVVTIMGDPVQVPFFIISVPVEGKPD